MAALPLIFANPEIIPPLHKALPGAQLHPFAQDIQRCRSLIADLDSQTERRAWLLYDSSVALANNTPVKDLINLSHQNTLIGPAELDAGPRFPDLSAVFEDDTGLIVVQGSDPDLAAFPEPWVPVTAGVWEAIALKHRGYSLRGWVITDVEKWVNGIKRK